MSWGEFLPEDSLNISADTGAKNFYKELDLPARVDPTSAKALYHNGVLGITLEKLERVKPKGEWIRVE
jgi:HSP20 family protein